MVDLIDETLKVVCDKCAIDDSFCIEKCCAYEETEENIEDGLKEWLSSFDTNSATECFTAVNLLKQRMEEQK